MASFPDLTTEVLGEDTAPVTTTSEDSSTFTSFETSTESFLNEATQSSITAEETTSPSLTASEITTTLTDPASSSSSSSFPNPTTLETTTTSSSSTSTASPSPTSTPPPFEPKSKPGLDTGHILAIVFGVPTFLTVVIGLKALHYQRKALHTKEGSVLYKDNVRKVLAWLPGVSGPPDCDAQALTSQPPASEFGSGLRALSPGGWGSPVYAERRVLSRRI